MSTPRTFAAPKIPNTPSATINKMLKSKFDKEFTSPIKYAVAFYICMVFQAITMVYGVINAKKLPSHTYWMVACGAVSVLLVTKVTIVYHIIASLDSLIYTLFVVAGVLIKLAIRYGFISLGLAVAGLGVSGMVFFDKEGEAPTTKGHATQDDTQTGPSKKME